MAGIQRGEHLEIAQALATDPFSDEVAESFAKTLRTRVEQERADEIKVIEVQEEAIDQAYQGVAAMLRIMDRTEHMDLETVTPEDAAVNS